MVADVLLLNIPILQNVMLSNLPMSNHRLSEFK